MRSAACIAVNAYPDPDSRLQGCLNDAHDWAAFLKTRGFDVKTLLDAEATKVNMLTAISDVINGLADGETGVVTWSGHGSWVPDLDGDELDGRDEVLCNYDMSETNLVVDDELCELFLGIRKGTRLVFITDSCHSGTVFRAAPPLHHYRKARFVPPHTFLSNPTALRAAELRYPHKTPSNAPLPGVIHFAACRDTEYSYDASFGDRANGAFTYTAMQVLRTLSPTASYGDLFRAIRGFLPSDDFGQSPRLNATRTLRNLVAFA